VFVLAVGALIVVLHVLRRRPPRVPFSSTVIWERVLRRRAARELRWRRLLSLLLALAAGLGLAFALTRPEAPAIGLSAARILLVVDNAASMAARTRDGTTRWQHALADARAVVDGAAPGSEFMVLDSTGRARLTGFLTREGASKALHQLPLPGFGTARVPPVVVEADVRMHVFTDGVALRDLPPGTVVHSVFQPADNVAITAFEARAVPGDPTRYEAFVQVFNASPRDTLVQLNLRGTGFTARQPLQLRAGESVDAVFDTTGFEGGVLAAAAAAPQDAFPLDDLAYTVVAPHARKQILLVTPGNPRLADALRALPGVALTVESPAAYGAPSGFDAYVFDRFAPAQAPTAGALLFRPPAVAWLPRRLPEARNATISSWDERHPVTAGIAWRDLAVRRVVPIDAHSPAYAELVQGPVSGGAMLAAGSARAPWIVVGFALEDSDLSLQSGFPVFLGNALSWLGARNEPITRSLGSIALSEPDAEVRDGAGRRVPTVRTGSGAVFQALQPDVYTVRGAARQFQIVAQLSDPRDADINQSRFTAGQDDIARAAQPGRDGAMEPWMLLLIVAAASLVVEWVTYTRRIGL
jgi:hypothetical protein